MPQTGRAVRRKSRRDEVLVAALRLFEGKGVAGVTASDLAREVGMSPTAIRYHFATDDDLLHALTSDFFTELDETMQRHPETPDWPNGVEQLVTDFVSVVLDHREVALLVHQDSSLSNRAEFGRRLQRALLQIRRAIAGPSPTDADVVAAVSAVGGMWRPIQVLAPTDVIDHLDAIVAVILSGHPKR